MRFERRDEASLFVEPLFVIKRGCFPLNPGRFSVLQFERIGVGFDKGRELVILLGERASSFLPMLAFGVQSSGASPGPIAGSSDFPGGEEVLHDLNERS